MRRELAPSVLSCDFASMASQVGQMIDAGVERIHFDVMDGQFVPPITFGSKLVADLRPLGATFFEAHLMTETPDRHFDAFVEAGCQGIIFHAEATRHPHRLAGQLRKMGVQAGIAINPGTPVEVVFPLLDVVDLVLVMTVNPGWGGQAFIPATLDKIAAIRARRPDIDIEVDGGIDPETMPRVMDAGANVFVAGSFIMGRPTIAQAVGELRAAWV